MKKLFSMVLAIAMITSIASVVASAAALNKVYVKAQSVEVSPNAASVIVDIVVEYTGNNGLLSAMFTVKGENGATLTKLTRNSSVVRGQCMLDIDQSNALGTVMIVNGSDADASIPSGSTLVTATFDIPANFAGETFNVVITPTGKSNFCDTNLNNLDAVGIDGAITVKNFTPGDVNGDGRINARDVIATVKFVINRWNISLVDSFIEDAADVDSDGKVTVKDVIQIMRMVIAIR